MVMALAGLWHGASWNFAIWGGLHGIALVLERQLLSKLVLPPIAICWLAKMLVTFTFVSFTWVCFILHDLGHVQLLIQHIFTDLNHPLDPNRFWLVVFFGLPVFLMHMVQLAKEQNKLQNILGHPYFRISALGTMIFLAIINPGPPHAFIYFQF
jgi:alginate O-acetyltransferase complex protein AlgI